MPNILRLVHVEYPENPYYNLAIEEAVARAVGENLAPNTLRLWRNDNTIVVGAFQCVSTEVKPEECIRYGVKVVRRFTGGGAVYHDMQNLNYAISFRRPSPIPGDDVLKAYQRVGEAVITGLRKLGIKAEFAPINDILVNRRKISGMAGMLTRSLLFVHGCILVSSNVEVLSKVLRIPKERVEIIDAGIVRAKVTTISNELKREVSMDEVKNALLKGFEEVFDAEFNPSKLTRPEREKAEELYESKYLTLDWNLGPCRSRLNHRDKDAEILRRMGLSATCWKI